MIKNHDFKYSFHSNISLNLRYISKAASNEFLISFPGLLIVKIMWFWKRVGMNKCPAIFFTDWFAWFQAIWNRMYMMHLCKSIWIKHLNQVQQTCLRCLKTHTKNKFIYTNNWLNLYTYNISIWHSVIFK